MREDPHRLAKVACLKSSTGSSLSDEESRVLDAFLQTSEGRAYREGTERMHEALRAPSPGIPRLDSSALVARFEQQMKSEARTLLQPRNILRLYLGFALVALLGSVLMFVVPHPRHGLSERIQGAAILSTLILGGALAIHVRARRRARDPQLFQRLWKAEVAQRDPRRYLVLALVVVLVGLASGWVQALGTAGGLLLLQAFLKGKLRKTRLKQDAELWGWWEETLR